MSGALLWKGPSEIDGESILLIAINNSTNRKTGGMIQTYILRSDVDPITATQSGADYSICGNCTHRHTDRGTCYVRVGTGPTEVWKSHKRENYPRLSLSEGNLYLTGQKVRLGTYGDPAAVPFHVWEALLHGMKRITGYTHQWHYKKYSPLSRWCMASCDTPEEQQQAKKLGWRTFTVVPSNQEVVRTKELLCPASEQAGKILQCQSCLACGGHSATNHADVFIPVHGLQFKQQRFNQGVNV